MLKPNCHECKFKRNVPGDAHISCAHPGARSKDPLMLALNIFFGGELTESDSNQKPLNVKFNPHGIRMGWVIFPINFDSAWLESCDGFQPKG